MGPKIKSPNLIKYWHQRYRLFSRYDDGIKLDDEAWWSVTPESIARHIAERVLSTRGDGHVLIVDGFCGVGGNLIQFALCSPHVRVIGCDIVLDRLKMAKHNAKIYGVQHQCEFIHGDFMKLMPSLIGNRVDAVFLSPPWGGVDYGETKQYSLSQMQPDGFEVMRLVRKHLTNNIAFLMPRNVDIREVSKKLLSKQNPDLECEQNLVGNKIKTITVYFGDLVDQRLDSDSGAEKSVGVGNLVDQELDSDGGAGRSVDVGDSPLERPVKKQNTGVRLECR